MKNNKAHHPTVLAFAGPNGSGKSTVTRGLSVFGTYVNADDLKAENKMTDLEAAKHAEALRNKLLSKGADFSFETVLSTDRNLLLLKKAKESGYDVQCVYVLTCDENINVARVRARVAAGGHGVPEDKIRNRYHRSLKLIPELVEICDKILIYDNSDMPTLIFKKENGIAAQSPNVIWTKKKLTMLLGI